MGAVHGGDGGQLPPELRKAVSNVVPNLEKMRLYRGRGGEVKRVLDLLREAIVLVGDANAPAAAEDALSDKRNKLGLGFADPKTGAFVEKSSVGLRTTMRTADDEATRDRKSVV